jgi:hypothetical protein
MTVDRAYVLADPGLSGEWAYTAMSRGRHHNAVYFAADRDQAREEFAPCDTQERTPIERLTTAMASSEATTLAIDTGAPVAPTFDQEMRAAEDAVRQGRAAREHAEACRLVWRPGVRTRSDAARQQEADANQRLARLRHRQAERATSRRDLRTDTIAQTRRALEAAQARRMERASERDFGIER